MGVARARASEVGGSKWGRGHGSTTLHLWPNLASLVHIYIVYKLLWLS